MNGITRYRVFGKFSASPSDTVRSVFCSGFVILDSFRKSKFELKNNEYSPVPIFPSFYLPQILYVDSEQKMEHLPMK